MNSAEVLEKLQLLSLSVKNISMLTDIPPDRIYKWYKGTSKPKADDYQKLMVLYQRLKPNPTNDFVENFKNETAEDAAKYSSSKDLQIEDLKQHISDLRLLVKALTEENERLKSRVVDVGKTGGRRS